MLKPIIDFSKRHVLGSISLVLSVVLSAGSRAIDVYHLFDLGLPAGMWEVIGLLVFFITIVVLFARFENSMTVGAKVSPSELSAPVPGIGRTPSSSAMVIAVVLSLLGGGVLGGFADNAINKPSRVHRFGPRTAINLTHTLKPAIERIPGVPPWHILFTNANGNEIVAGDVKSVLTLSTRNIESIPMPNYESDINAPRFRGGSLSGLIIHGKNQLSEELKNILSSCFIMSQADYPGPDVMQYYGFSVTWIEVGPGSPWRTPDACES